MPYFRGFDTIDLYTKYGIMYKYGTEPGTNAQVGTAEKARYHEKVYQQGY